MSKSSTTQSLADSTMALLGKAMDRNSRLAAPPPVVPPLNALVPPLPAAASTGAPVAVVVRTRPITSPPRIVRTSGLRFTAQDHQRINRILNQALALGERIPMSDAVRLALIAYDPRALTTADLMALQATDGRMRRRTPVQ
ncbi:MAG: hypothetical protein WCI73_00345 [Phycisphaerae bacterium]